ncbi:MAG: [protein-PII] uridylyltransferase [Gammaproteobacteria bacterium]|nr:[protein-PII] uridylyltransferase [Gammaproteobacteria bacterium]
MNRLSHSEIFDEHKLDKVTINSAEGVEAFGDLIYRGHNVLSEYHLSGGRSDILCKQRVWMTDRILIRAWKQSRDLIDCVHTPSLIAVGGYGRGELNLASDIDLLFLMPNKIKDSHIQHIEKFVQLCWDIGIKIGHSSRTLSDCLKYSKHDLTIATSMMEMRLLEGNQKSFDQLNSKMRGKAIWPPYRFFQAKIEEQSNRHLRYGETQFNLEPNLKESPGGLRDLHMISWITNRYFGTKRLEDLVAYSFITEQEYRTLINSKNFLWKLRNGLHLLAGRCEDRLLFDLQRDLSCQLGYHDDSTRMGVEKLMQQYYRTAKEVQILNETVLQHFDELIFNTKPPTVRKINERFNQVGKLLQMSSPNVFDRHPTALLEMFYVMQRNPELTGVESATVRKIRSSLHLIDGKFRKDPENRRLFLEIFKHPTGLTHALRRMNTYGVLGRFFPAWGRIVGQMQHDLFHIFTVDTHSLFVIRNLRRFMVSEYQNEFPILSDLISKLNQRERLFLAALCHDIGKGSGRDHSEVGEKIALSLCQRIGMNEYDANFVSWLVRHHLLMSFTAQKEDTSDPRIIERFAEQVGDQEHLDNLYLLTVADIRGTSHTLWNEWKGRLLSNLYHAASRLLRTGLGYTEAIEQRVVQRKQAIRKLVDPQIDNTQLYKFWAQMDQEYFLRNAPITSAWQAEQICNASLSDLPLVAIRHRPEIDAEQILIVTSELGDQLVRATAALDSLRLGILDARMHHTNSGLSIMIFIATNTDVYPITDQFMEQQREKLRKFILSPVNGYNPVALNLPRTKKQFKVPTRVIFEDNKDLGHTTMEVTSQDRPSLLYNVARALYEHKVRLVSAKVSTLGEKAEDTFFITDRDGFPMSDPRQRSFLESRIKLLLN